ncbi:hypothetical protein H8356DRAFT_1350873 [Neocallimastix lanati (nom. inval.)]|nr:hypothetical protein H8356DRAFT_1350873 [Neocallimastix sp. JGI-2020a]
MNIVRPIVINSIDVETIRQRRNSNTNSIRGQNYGKIKNTLSSYNKSSTFYHIYQYSFFVSLYSILPVSRILLINCKLRRSQSSLHTARRCIPNVPTYISNDHEHQNGTINSSLVGVIIGDWKFYNHQGLCFNSKRSIRVGLMDITCGLMISQDRNLIRLFVTCIVLTDWTNMTKVFGYRPGNNSSAFNVSTHEGAGTFQALANKELTSPKANWASRL